jgi:ribonucleoside-diphosphate reductase alpha chain
MGVGGIDMAQSSIGVERRKNGAGASGTAKGAKASKAGTKRPVAASKQAAAKKDGPRSVRGAAGISVERRLTTAGVDPLENGAPAHGGGELVYERRSSIITNPDGSIVFKMEGAEIPSRWSQLATDIVISKYFRKAGLYGEKDRGERSVAEIVHRIAHTIRAAGERFGGYFATKSDADTFEAELKFLMVHQVGAFNSPVWFNCGLWHEYGIQGSGGNWAWNGRDDRSTTEAAETKNAYERPQCSACFIQAVPDDLMGMYDLIKSEARLFKYGSGTGSNFSAIRGKQEKLSGGGTSSGLMSFLEVFDAPRGRPSPVAPRDAPRRWCASTWTTRRSPTSSTGRSARRRRRTPSSPRASRRISTARRTTPSAARTRTTPSA